MNKQELDTFLESEVRKHLLKEGMIADKKIVAPVIKETSEPIEFEKSSVVDESENVDIEDVKTLSEEFKRMRELIDFRSPLLIKD